jgi:tRNA(Ile)-lysidine synthetase-like protein
MKRLIPSAPDERVLLAVSGGVDSMVLLSHYQNTASQVVHFNYHTRALSNQDEAFVMAQAQKYGVPCVVIHVPELKGGNFQEKARSYRYDVLSDLAITQGFEKVLLAHHQDDAVETLLLQLLRGTSLQHLGLNKEIHWKGMVFERPFYAFTKAELQEYAASNNISYVEDASNQSDDYLRNRLRHQVIPLLEAEQPKLSEKIAQLTTQSTLLKEYFNNETNELFVSKSRRLFQNTAPILQDHTLLRWCHDVQIEPHSNLIQLLKRVLMSSEPQTKVQLSPSLWCVVTYDLIAFTGPFTSEPFNIEINAHGEYELPNRDIVIISTTKPDQSENYIQLTSQDISFPLQIRTRLDGDQLSMNYGHKSLSDYLIDQKVPNQQRDSLVVLAKANQILWIPAMKYHVTQLESPSLYVKIKDNSYE